MKEPRKDDREFITTPFPKGSKAKIRVYAAKNGYKGVAECVRVAVDTLMAQKAKEEAVASEIRGVE